MITSCLNVAPCFQFLDVEGREALGIEVDQRGARHAHAEILVHFYIELLRSRVNEVDLFTILTQNDDAFFQVVKDLVVADAHDFRLHKDHANLCYDEMDEEEAEDLKDADAYHLNDINLSDLLAEKEVDGGQL